MSADTPIQLSEGASKRLYKLRKIEGNPNLKFRIYITGGGCSGFQYGFGFEQEAQGDDIILKTQLEVEAKDEYSELEIIVDPMSMTYLDGAEVIYQEGLYGSHFTIKNPHAKNTCGCGNSFSI